MVFLKGKKLVEFATKESPNSFTELHVARFLCIRDLGSKEATRYVTHNGVPKENMSTIIHKKTSTTYMLDVLYGSFVVILNDSLDSLEEVFYARVL